MERVMNADYFWLIAVWVIVIAVVVQILLDRRKMMKGRKNK